MKHWLAAGALLTATFSARGPAQNTLFVETFSAGIPASWTHFALGTPFDPWRPGFSPVTSSPDIYHEWFCNNGFSSRNNILMSSPIDLTGFTRVDFSCVQHQLFPANRLLNRVEVSTNSGSSFTPIYTETGTWSGAGTIQVSLDAFAGLPNVRVAFHYMGTIANEWRIDDVRITTPQPILNIVGLTAAGTASFPVTGATAGALVVFGLSISGSGPTPTPFGAIGLTPPICLLPLQIADASGAASSTLAIPAAASGIVLYAQAGVFSLAGTANFSNWRRGIVQ